MAIPNIMPHYRDIHINVATDLIRQPRSFRIYFATDIVLRYEILLLMTTNIALIWHVTQFSLVQFLQIFRENFYFHFLSLKQKQQIPPKRW
jgi:hypothetical protein